MPTFLTLLETHEEISLPLICASALACLFLQFAARFASEGLLQRLRAQGLSFKDEWEWTNRLVSTVHCTSIGSIALYWLHFLYTRCDSNAAYVTGAMPYSGVVSSVSIGYFVWDTLYLVLMDRSVMRQWQHEQALAAVANAKSAQPHLMTLPKAPKPCADWKMLLHHVLAALGQYASVSTKGLPVCYVCLLVMECTTTLLNTTWLRRKAGLDSGAFHKMLEVIFVLLWVPLRLVIPGYCIVYMQRDFAVIWDTAPPLPLYTGFVMIPFLNILNWIWFIQIIKIISGINDKAKSG